MKSNLYTNMAKKKWLTVPLAFSLAIQGALALSPGTFTRQPLNPGDKAEGIQLTRIALMDTSQQSQDWLRRNHDYLRTQKIPLMVLGASEADVKALSAEYVGLLAGPAPQPPELLEAVMHRLGVMIYPVVIEDGIAWQVRDERVQKSPRERVQAIPEPQPAVAPGLAEGPDTEPSAEAVALQRDIDARRAAGADATRSDPVTPVPGTGGGRQ